MILVLSFPLLPFFPPSLSGEPCFDTSPCLCSPTLPTPGWPRRTGAQEAAHMYRHTSRREEGVGSWSCRRRGSKGRSQLWKSFGINCLRSKFGRFLPESCVSRLFLLYLALVHPLERWV